VGFFAWWLKVIFINEVKEFNGSTIIRFLLTGCYKETIDICFGRLVNGMHHYKLHKS